MRCVARDEVRLRDPGEAPQATGSHTVMSDGSRLSQAKYGMKRRGISRSGAATRSRYSRPDQSLFGSARPVPSSTVRPARAPLPGRGWVSRISLVRRAYS